MNPYETDNILDYELKERVSSGWIIKIVGVILLLSFAVGAWREWQIHQVMPEASNLLYRIPTLLTSLAGGIGLLTDRRFGWYLAVITFIFNLVGRSYGFISFLKSDLNSTGATSIILLISILFIVLMIAVLYRKRILSYFEIDRHSQMFVPIGTALVAVIFMFVLS